MSSEETTESIIGDSEQVCEICTRSGACACDTCMQTVCLRCGYTWRHDITQIRGYVRLRERAIAEESSGLCATQQLTFVRLLEEALVDASGHLQGCFDRPSIAAQARYLRAMSACLHHPTIGSESIIDP